MIAIRLEPLDTWFFRGGTPFARGDTPQEAVESLFPPHPATVTGALRAALAQARGWDGHGRWPEAFDQVLGNGPEDPGRLCFDGPFLLQCGKPLFRAPRHLLGVKKADGWQPCALLQPGPPVQCDLGTAVRLPEQPQDHDHTTKPTTGDEEWLTLEGLTAVLHGKLPDPAEVVPQNTLWSVEDRIGLERDRDTRSAKEGMLYSTRHVRPARDVSLGLRVAGLPADWTVPFGQLVPLGGESRLAECREWQDGPALDTLTAKPGSAGRVTLIALSPIDLEPDVIRGEQLIDSLGGARVVSACIDRPQRIGGWDSLTRRPLPLRSVLAPGNVLFCEVPEAGMKAVTSGNLLRIGARQAWGFGLVACGGWSEV